MNILDLLRKTGILRYGKKKYRFSEGPDIPPEALCADVFAADKDLVNKENLGGFLHPDDAVPEDRL